MDEQLKQRIRDDLRRTGFVVEVEGGAILRQNGWLTFHNSSYFDRDEEKSREVDIVARR